MRKALLTLLVLFTITLVVQSQKDVVYVEYFSFTNSIGESQARGIRDKIIAGLIATDRIVVKDVDSESSLRREGQRQTEDASSVDEERLVTLKRLNAQYLIQGHITAFHANREVDKQGDVSYKGVLNFSLKVIDIATGTLKGTEVFSHGNEFLSFNTTGTSEDDAKASIQKFIPGDMVKFVNKNFPMEGTILEINAEKKGEATEVYISLGELDGVQKGQDFKVFVVREIAGRKSNKEIGELKATAVEGEDLTLCKVTKGGKEIKEAVGEGLPTIVRSFRKKGFLEQ